MRPRLGIACKPYRIAFFLILPPLISAWTCSSIVNFKSCPGAAPQPRITALSPDTISSHVVSAPLTVEGNGFVEQSEILWNGNPLQTTLLDSYHLEATITQQIRRWASWR